MLSSQPHIFDIQDPGLLDLICNLLQIHELQKPLKLLWILEQTTYAEDLQKIKAKLAEQQDIQVLYLIKESIDFEKIDVRCVDHILSINCPDWQKNLAQLFRYIHGREQDLSPRDLTDILTHTLEFTPKAKPDFEIVKDSISEILESHFQGILDIHKILIAYTEIIHNCIYHGFQRKGKEKYSPATFQLLESSDIVWIRITYDSETFRLEISDNGGNLTTAQVKDAVYRNNHPLEFHLKERGRGIALTQKLSHNEIIYIKSGKETFFLVEFASQCLGNCVFSTL